MKRLRFAVCIVLATLIACLPVFGNDLPDDKVESGRTGMTLFGAELGLGIGPFLNPSAEGASFGSLQSLVSGWGR